MKIENNFDLISKITELENGYDIKKEALRNLKISALIYGAFSIIDIAQNDFNFLNELIGYGVCNCTMNILDAILYGKAFKQQKQFMAGLDMLYLIQKLKSLNIQTTVEMLKEAEVTKTNYKLMINENKLPVIKQNKYILIPTYSEYKIDSKVSLLQEHTLGSKKFILSIGEPQKKLTKKLAYNV